MGSYPTGRFMKLRGFILTGEQYVGIVRWTGGMWLLTLETTSGPSQYQISTPEEILKHINWREVEAKDEEDLRQIADLLKLMPEQGDKR